MASGSILVPIRETGDVLAVPHSSLPDVPTELIGIFHAEVPPLRTWFHAARAYLAQGKQDQFLKLLQEATKPDTVSQAQRHHGAQTTYDQVQILCALAAYCINKSKEGGANKAEQLGRASNYVSLAQRLDDSQQLPYLASGLLLMAKGTPADVKGAVREFSLATTKKDNGRRTMAGDLLKAVALFHQAKYNEALPLFQKVLQKQGSTACPPEVRLGLAACFFRTGDMARARAAYERVLELDPTSAEAYVGLATIALKGASPPSSSNGGDVSAQQGLLDGLRLLSRAYQVDPHHAPALAMLAHYCLLRGEYARVKLLASAALGAAETDSMRAECHCLLARACHALGDLPAAQSHYMASGQADPSLALPRLGIAQMFIRGREYVNAASELEAAVASSASGLTEAAKLLGALSPLAPVRVARSVGLVREAAGRLAGDAQIWEALGEMAAGSDPTEALAAYKKALHLAAAGSSSSSNAAAGSSGGGAAAGAATANGGGGSDAADGLPARLLNNAAVLHARLGEHGEALRLMGAALSSQSASPQQRVTMGYNLARVQEAAGETQAAKSRYLELLQHFPEYTDCCIRLSAVAEACGCSDEAASWAQRVLESDADNGDALITLIRLHMVAGRFSEAAKLVSTAKASPRLKDEPALSVSHGNWMLYVSSSSGGPDRQLERLQTAVGFYKRALQADPRNVYAANGLAAALAESRHYGEALEVLARVMEAASADPLLRLPDAFANMGSCHLAQGEHAQAVRMYKHAIREAPNDTRLLVYLARAHYDGNDLRGARRALQRALHASPGDPHLSFNLAFVMQGGALMALKDDGGGSGERRAADLQAASNDMEGAVRIFSQLATTIASLPGVDVKKAQKVLGPLAVDAKKLQHHIDYCNKILPTLRQRLAKAVQEANKQAAERERQRKQAEVAEQEKRLAEIRAAEAARLAQAARDEAAREAQARNERRNEEWRQRRGEVGAAAAGLDAEDGGAGAAAAASGKKSRKGGKRSKKGARAADEDEGVVADDDAAVAAEEEEEAAAGGAEEEPEADMKELFGEESDEEQPVDVGPLPEDDGEQDMMDDGDGADAAAGTAKKSKKKRLRAAGADDAEAAPAAANDGLEDLEDAGAAGESGAPLEEGAAPSSQRKRMRKAAVVDDEEADDAAADT